MQVVMAAKIPITQKRRVLEKRRIHTLKTWHENVKRIAKSEIDFINSILQDDKDSKDRDWIRDYEEDEDTFEGNGEVVKKNT